MTGLSYDDLVAVATVGVSRRPVRISGLAGPAGEHASVLHRGDPGAAVLDAAALLVAARRAGFQPVPGIVCPAPAAPGTAPELSARAGRLLAQVVSDTGLLADLLTAATAAGHRAPAPLLPELLDAAVKHAPLRPVVAAVLGTRGRWLAGHQPAWRRVADAGMPEDPGDSDAWETGSRAERLAHLARLRRCDPAAGLRLLGLSWGCESGADRADLLATFANGLSAGDEEFLEFALDDRKDSVRATARRLLARLPSSAFNRRAAQRAAPLLRLEWHGMRRMLVAVLPDLIPDRAAIRDGITARSPAVTVVGTGPWLFTQMIAAAPLAGWVTAFGVDPGGLVSLPIVGGLRVDVHAGWRLAAIRQASSQWAEPLLAAREPGQARRRPPAAWPPDHELAALLPPDARAARAAALLAEAPAAPATLTEVTGCPPPWPQALATAVIAALRAAAASARAASWPVPLAAAAARGLPAGGPADYAAVLAGIAAAESCPLAWSAAFRRAGHAIVLRRAFLKEIT